MLHKPHSLAAGRWGEGILYCGAEHWRVLSTERVSHPVPRILKWLLDFWKSCELPDSICICKTCMNKLVLSEIIPQGTKY